jgi:F-type H+-transporting ATPase subunit b
VLDFSITFLITVVNVTFLYLVLRKILFKPVTKFMEDRSEKIRRDLESAKLATARAEALEADFNAKILSAKEEGQKIMQQSRDRAKQERDEIIAQAKADAAKIVAASRAELESERREAERLLLGTTADLTIRAASKVLRANIDSEKNRELVEAFLETAGAS